MYKKCKVVMLSTKKQAHKGDIIWNPIKDELIVFEHTNSTEPIQHLYILSDDINDKNHYHWMYMDLNGFAVYPTYETVETRHDNLVMKIIASTDSLRIYTEPFINGTETFKGCIPSIPQSFIDKYVSEYNKGNKIEEVEVEYEYDIVAGNGHIEPPEVYSNPVLLINDDNTINIKPIKDSWTKEEVIELIRKYGSDIHKYTISKESFDEWIETNL